MAQVVDAKTRFARRGDSGPPDLRQGGPGDGQPLDADEDGGAGTRPGPASEVDDEALDDRIGKGDDALACHGLGVGHDPALPDDLLGLGPHVDLPAFKVDIRPGQAEHLSGTESRKPGNVDEGTEGRVDGVGQSEHDGRGQHRPFVGLFGAGIMVGPWVLVLRRRSGGQPSDEALQALHRDPLRSTDPHARQPSILDETKHGCAAQPDERRVVPPICRSFVVYTGTTSYILQLVAKHLIDLDEDALGAAQAELGTTTIKDTVNGALRRATAERQQRVSSALDVLGDADLDDRSEAWR